MFALSTPEELALGIARNARAARLARNMTQAEAAKRSAMPISTYRLFEQTGQVSLERLLRLAIVLDATADFADLFPVPPIRSLDELKVTKPARRRARSRT
jgi:transcriptional regulator with XRE-family HTH domain